MIESSKFCAPWNLFIVHCLCSGQSFSSREKAVLRIVPSTYIPFIQPLCATKKWYCNVRLVVTITQTSSILLDDMNLNI